MSNVIRVRTTETSMYRTDKNGRMYDTQVGSSKQLARHPTIGGWATEEAYRKTLQK